jgi:transcriptional regulator GlxA family with amidase domain
LLGQYFAERVVSRQTTGNRNEALERLLLLEAHDLASSPAAVTTGAPPLGPSSVTARALRFLEANLFARVDLMEVARAAGASRSSVLRHFRGDVGLSPMAYVQGRRLDEARRLLGRTRMDVREVATMVGYANAGAFSEAYRRRFGHSPSSDGTG